LPAMAQDTTEGPPGEETASETETDSRMNRDDRNVYIGFSPFGLHIPTLLTAPFSVGYILNSDWMFGLEYGSLDFELGDAKGNYTNQGLYARWYPTTNSFNILMGYHIRSLELDWTYEAKAAGVTYTVDSGIDYSAQVATVGIGNQWMMDWGLVIGLDWLMLSGVMGSSFSFTDPTLPGGVQPDAQTLADIEKAEKEAQDALDSFSAFPGLFVLSLGFSF